jgi:hypothetical protein
MVKRKKVENLVFCLILLSVFLLIPLISAENIIFGNPIPEAERLSSINVTSNTFQYGTGDYIKVSAYNSNGSLIDVDNVTIEFINAKNNIDYEATSVSQDLNQIYKRGFTIGNENLTNINFKITVIKGDKTITQDYTTTISKNSVTTSFKDKAIASVNIIWNLLINNWVTIMIVIIIIFMMIFIIKGIKYLMK